MQADTCMYCPKSRRGPRPLLHQMCKQCLERAVGYRAAFRDKRLVYTQNKRCRELGIEGVLTLEDWWVVCDAAGDKCVVCGQTEELSIDHIIPISKGGKNIQSNIQPLCKPCNSRKGNKL